MNAPEGYLRLKTMVWSSGTSTLSTMLYCGRRELMIPSGGNMILS